MTQTMDGSARRGQSKEMVENGNKMLRLSCLGYQTKFTENAAIHYRKTGFAPSLNNLMEIAELVICLSL